MHAFQQHRRLKYINDGGMSVLPCLKNTGKTISTCTSLTEHHFYPGVYKLWEETSSKSSRGDPDSELALEIQE